MRPVSWVTKPHPAERHWRLDTRGKKSVCHAVSQNPTQPKGIGDLLQAATSAASIVWSQNPTQPKGIGDRSSPPAWRGRGWKVTKPHPAERHWRHNVPASTFMAGIESQNPTQPKGIGDSRSTGFGLSLRTLRVTKPHPAERHWRLLTRFQPCLQGCRSQNPTQPKGIGDSVSVSGMSVSGILSQNPTQPKGIGDLARSVRFGSAARSHKTPPSRKALETCRVAQLACIVLPPVTKPHPAERHWRLIIRDDRLDQLIIQSQNPTQPKGIGDSIWWIRDSSARATSQNPTQPKGIGD